jgi:prolipoprotein diacylglyceryltransferase
MLNWITYGIIPVSDYSSPVIFSVAVFLWFIILKKYIPIKENYRLLVKVAAVSLLGAALTPLIMIIMQGNLVPFFKDTFSTIGKIHDFKSLKRLFYIANKGFSITGGLTLLSIVLFFIVEDAKKLSFGILYPFPLFAAIARVNCLLQGCCFGVRYEGPFAIVFPPGSIVSKFHKRKYGLISMFEKSFPVFPSQIAIILSMLLLFLILFIMNKYKVKKHIIAGSSLIGYGFFNFIIEMFRQETRIIGDYLTAGQIMELFLIFLGLFVIFKMDQKSVTLNSDT